MDKPLFSAIDTRRRISRRAERQTWLAGMLVPLVRNRGILVDLREDTYHCHTKVCQQDYFFPRMSSSAGHGAAPLRPVPRSKGCITCTSRKTRCGSLMSIRHRHPNAPLTQFSDGRRPRRSVASLHTALASAPFEGSAAGSAPQPKAHSTRLSSCSTSFGFSRSASPAYPRRSPSPSASSSPRPRASTRS